MIGTDGPFECWYLCDGFGDVFGIAGLSLLWHNKNAMGVVLINIMDEEQVKPAEKHLYPFQAEPSNFL